MSVGNTHSFFIINGVQFTDDDLPLDIEGGKYKLTLGPEVKKGFGTNYMLSVGMVTVDIRVMKFLIAVDLHGVDYSFREGTTGGLIGQVSHQRVPRRPFSVVVV